MQRRDTPLTIEIVDDVLTISIGVATLAYAVQQGDVWEGMPKIVDADVFARDVKDELEREDEEGTNPVHELLDAAAVRAVGEGSLGVAE